MGPHDWYAFDVSAYIEHNYRRILPPDRVLVERLVSDWREIGALAPQPLRHADVGTGPNLYPLLVALPHVATSEALEVSASGRGYLLGQLEEVDGVWDQWRELIVGLGGAPGLSEDAMRRAWRIGATSIYELPAASYDVTSSFFCAESITDDEAQFTAATASLAGSVAPGGHLLAAFMLGSRGYETAGAPYPAVPVELDDIARAFEPHLEVVSLEPIGAVEEVRSGYSGMAYLHARRSRP